MKKGLLTFAMLMFANQTLAATTLECTTLEQDSTTIYTDSYSPSVSNSPAVHSAEIEGAAIDPQTVSILVLELNTKCEENQSQESGCRLLMKVDLNANGKFEFEYEVWRQPKNETTSQNTTEYQGRILDYRTPPLKIKEATCTKTT